MPTFEHDETYTTVRLQLVGANRLRQKFTAENTDSVAIARVASSKEQITLGGGFRIYAKTAYEYSAENGDDPTLEYYFASDTNPTTVHVTEVLKRSAKASLF